MVAVPTRIAKPASWVGFFNTVFYNLLKTSIRAKISGEFVLIWPDNSMIKFLIISASGMGCTIMFTPTLRALRRKFPEAKITFLGTTRSFVEPVAGSNLVDEVLVFDFAKTSLFNLGKLGPRLKMIRQLRRRRFDYSLTVFPSNKWFFNVFAWLAGAKKRLTHRYSTPAIKTLAGLQNVRIPADPKLHDVDQDINLLKPFDLEVPQAERRLFFHTFPENEVWAENFCRRNSLVGQLIVGMHIGSSKDFSFAAKRWPLERFAELSDKIQRELKMPVLVFAGPDEKDEVRELLKLTRIKPLVVTESLKNAAALIKKCRCFVSSDTGLMHVAVAMDTPVVAIFGPTMLSRTRPYTSKKEIAYNPQLAPLLKYPFFSTTAEMKPEKVINYFDGVGIDQVILKIRQLLSSF